MDKRRTSVAILMPLVIGLIGSVNAERSVRIQALHAVDYLLLLAVGMCFGVALANALRAGRGKTAGSE